MTDIALAALIKRIDQVTRTGDGTGVAICGDLVESAGLVAEMINISDLPYMVIDTLPDRGWHALRHLADDLPATPNLLVIENLPGLATTLPDESRVQHLWDRIQRSKPVLLLITGAPADLTPMFAYDRPLYGRADFLRLPDLPADSRAHR